MRTVKKRDNKVTKEYLKFLAAFEVVEAFPLEFYNIKIDLELSIADAVDKSCVYFTTWMASALENATNKGFAVMYRDKIHQPLSLVKGKISNNSAAVNIVSEEAKKKFIESWKNTTVDIVSNNNRRLKIEEVVKPMISSSDKSQAVIKIQAVKVVALAKKEGKNKKKNLSFNSATIVKKPESYIQPAPEEQRKPINAMGIPDDELFGPSFLYQKPEVWTEKKITSANPVGVKPKMKYTP